MIKNPSSLWPPQIDIRIVSVAWNVGIKDRPQNVVSGFKATGITTPEQSTKKRKTIDVKKRLLICRFGRAWWVVKN